VLETKTWSGYCVYVGPKAGVNRKVDIDLDKGRLKLDFLGICEQKSVYHRLALHIV
jgi:hypothetical protein